MKNSWLSTKKTQQQRCRCSFQLFYYTQLVLNPFEVWTLMFSYVSLSVWQETTLKEQVEGLVEEDEEKEEAANEDEEDVAVGAITLAEKKTERQRKKEKAEKIKVN